MVVLSRLLQLCFRLDDLPGYALRKPHNPDDCTQLGLGYSPFARRYSGNLV